MTPAPPKLTVIMATFDMSAVLPFSIGSVLRQSFADFELLVVGDGCTDDSEAVVAAMGDDRIRWINLDSNSGHQSTPNNEGLRQARGDLVAYLGHDDLWLPHHLSALTAAIAAGADLAYGITALIRPGAGRPEAWVQPCYRPGICIPPSSVVHRRGVALEAGGWPDYRGLRADPEAVLWERAHQAGRRLDFVPRLTCIKFPASWRKDVYRHRPHHEQASWLERIEAEQGLEAHILARLLTAVAEEREEREQRPIRRLRAAAGRLLRKAGLRGPGPGEGVLAHQRFKGLDRPGS